MKPKHTSKAKREPNTWAVKLRQARAYVKRTGPSFRILASWMKRFEKEVQGVQKDVLRCKRGDVAGVVGAFEKRFGKQQGQLMLQDWATCNKLEDVLNAAECMRELRRVVERAFLDPVQLAQVPTPKELAAWRRPKK